MTASTALRLADDTAAIERIAELFHRVGKLLPDEPDVISILPTDSVQKSIKLLQQNGVSHVPVVLHDEVLGVFSYDSFTRHVMSTVSDGFDATSMPVEEMMEYVTPQHFVSVKDELQAAIELVDRHGFALVGFIEQLQGIVTSSELRDHLHRTARPFVLLAEIEGCIRKLIRFAVDGIQMADCVRRAQAYKKNVKEAPGKIRKDLEDMVFSDYIYIIEEPQNWQEHFRPVFGGLRQMQTAKLDEVRKLRNDVFHFKRELTLDEHDTLSGHRDWILMRARQADAHMRGGVTGVN